MPGVHFNTVTFGVPVEKFRVESFVSEQSRESIVNEYVLRFLRISGRVQMQELVSFFGFTMTDMIVVVESLAVKNLVETDGECLQLTQRAESVFDQSGDDYPRFTAVTQRQDNVAFDLATFSPLKSKSIESHVPSDNIVKFEVAPEFVNNSIVNAKRAFRSRFAEIAAEDSSLRDNALSVYSITDIESRGRSYIRIPVSFSLEDDGSVVRGFDEEFSRNAPDGLLQYVHESISDSVKAEAADEAVGIAEFAGVFNIGLYANYLKEKQFDLFAYLADVHFGDAAKLPGDITPIVGNLYLPENLELITTRLIERRRARKGRGKVYASAAWMVPDIHFWGRGSAFEQACGSISEILDDDVQDELFVFAGTSPANRGNVVNKYRVRNLEKVHFFDSSDSVTDRFSGRLELFIYPSQFMVALFHLEVSGADGILLPIGFLSTQSKHLAAAYQILRQRCDDRKYLGKGNLRGPRDSSNGMFEHECRQIDYSDLPEKRERKKGTITLKKRKD